MKALLIIDVQNDFCPGGALAVPDGNLVVPVINKLSGLFDTVIQTQDWHPAGHSSFASTHPGKEPFESISLPYGEQILWPDHCVQATDGAAFHPELDTNRTQLIIRKGFRRSIDSYSAFYENDGKTPTGLTGYLRDRGVTTLYAVGLATDYCVKWSVLDGIKEEFELFVVEDAVRGIDIEGSVAGAWDEMEKAGAVRVTSKKIQKG